MLGRLALVAVAAGPCCVVAVETRGKGKFGQGDRCRISKDFYSDAEKILGQTNFKGRVGTVEGITSSWASPAGWGAGLFHLVVGGEGVPKYIVHVDRDATQESDSRRKGEVAPLILEIDETALEKIEEVQREANSKLAPFICAVSDN